MLGAYWKFLAVVENDLVQQISLQKKKTIWF